MFAWLNRRSPASELAPPAPAVPPGRRVYAIGDVHGRADLLDDLLALIDADDRGRAGAETLVVLLGDLVDRGPDSAGVIERVCREREGPREVRAIMGNHEELLLAALDGDADALRRSLRVGGVATLASYGLSVERLEREVTEADGLALVRAYLPERHRAFLAAMEGPITVGDYLFVHAGVRPGVPLAEQSGADLRWIRREFLDHRGSFGPIVVHGHSIRTEPDTRANRVGIDTGAYRTGRLTALGLEGSARWLLATGPGGGYTPL